MALALTYLVFVFWVLVVILAAKGSDRLCANAIGKPYRLFMIPGVVVHEVSHAIACLITFAKIKKITIYEETGGSVTHEAPKIPIVGQAFISLAPILGCGLVLALCWRGFPGGPLSSLVKEIPGSTKAWALGLHSVWDLACATFGHLKEANWRSWVTYVCAYLIVTNGIALAPSKQDFRNALLGIVGVGVILFVAHLVAHWLGRGEALASVLLKPLWPLVTLVFGVLLLLLGGALIIWSVVTLVKVLFKKGK